MYIGLDRGHPLARGLISAHPFLYPSNRYVYDRLNHIPCPVSGAEIDGQSMYFDQSDTNPVNYIDITTPQMIDIQFPFTMVASGKASDPDATEDGTLMSLSEGSVNNGYGCIYFDYTENTFGLVARWAYIRRITGGVLLPDTWHQVVGVFASPTDRRLYVDGELVASHTIEHTMNVSCKFAAIGTTKDNDLPNGERFGGHIDYGYFYNRELSVREIRELHRDPYQMYIKTDTPDMYSQVGAGSGIFAGLPGAGVHITDRWGNEITSPVLLERWG